MKDLPRITEIIKREPYKVTCRWTTGEIMVVDFNHEFERWQKTNNTTLLLLKDFKKFENVTIKDGTLQWYSIMVSYKGLDGAIKKQPLDLDPDKLYKLSKPITHYKLVLDITDKKQKVV
ncbi:MAG: hypothetical protein ABFS35_04090 [Bacteroidota bacterium]